MRRLVEQGSFRPIATLSHRYEWSQHDFDETPATICRLLHDTLRHIHVGKHNNACLGTQMQVPELVTR